MSVLIVTGMEGIRNLAQVIQARLGIQVEVAEDRKAALAAMRKREFEVVVVDETFAAGDSGAADAIWQRARLGIPVQVNFALSGAERLIREIRAALERREREQAISRQAAAAALEAEVRSTVAGLLLHSQLALSSATESSPAADRLRLMADLAATLREQLNSRTDCGAQVLPHPRSGRGTTPKSGSGARTRTSTMVSPP